MCVASSGWKSALFTGAFLLLAACNEPPTADDIANAVGVRRVDNVSCSSASDGRGGYICSYRRSGVLMSSVARLKRVNNQWRAVE